MAESRQRPVGKGGFQFPPFPTPNPLKTTKHRGELRLPPIGCTPRGLRLPRPTMEGTPGSATTSRRPPTQAAKKCGIGPQLFPVPPAESPVDGAGPLRGVKTGRRIPIWNHLTHSGAPFSLDSKNRSFSSREKETGFEPSLPSFHVTERQRNEAEYHAARLPLIRPFGPPSPRGRLDGGTSGKPRFTFSPFLQGKALLFPLSQTKRNQI